MLRKCGSAGAPANPRELHCRRVRRVRSLPVFRAPDAPFAGADLSIARCDRRPLPMSAEESRERGWDEVDVVFVTGDAYVDHPSFAMALLGRLLESAGFRVAVLSQPDWRSAEAFRAF